MIILFLVLLSNSAAALARRNYRGDHYHCFRLAQRALQTTPSYKVKVNNSRYRLFCLLKSPFKFLARLN